MYPLTYSLVDFRLLRKQRSDMNLYSVRPDLSRRMLRLPVEEGGVARQICRGERNPIFILLFFAVATSRMTY